MKSLVVFSSRTGMTQTVGTEIAEALQSDVEELLDVKKRTGYWGSYDLAARRVTRSSLSFSRQNLIQVATIW